MKSIVVECFYTFQIIPITVLHEIHKFILKTGKICTIRVNSRKGSCRDIDH